MSSSKSLLIIILALFYYSNLFSQEHNWELLQLFHYGSAKKVVVNSSGDIFAINENGVFRSTDDGKTWEIKNNGLTDFNINDIVITKTGSLLVATNSGGGFRSYNNGDNWISISDFDENNIQALVMDNNGLLYAGMNENGIAKSTDNGETWTTSRTGLTNTNVRFLACDSLGGVYAGTTDGVFISEDNAENWKRTNGFLDTSITKISVKDSGYILAKCFTENVVYLSTDKGQSWNYLKKTIKVGPVTREIIIGTDFAEFTSIGDIVISQSKSLSKSTDNGINWISTTEIPSRNGTTFFDEGSVVKNFSIYSNETYYVCMSDGIYRTTNSGVSWDSIGVKISDINVNDIEIGSDGNIFAGTENGLFRSTDLGINWTENNKGIEDYKNIYKILSNKNGDIFADGFYLSSGFPDLIFRSTDSGNSWLPTNGSYGFNGFCINDSGYIYAVSYLSLLGKSTDNGESWIYLKTGFAVALTIDRKNNILLVKPPYLFRSADDGKTWSHKSFIRDSSWYSGTDDENYTKIALNSKGFIYITTSDSLLYRSTDDGETWTRPKMNLPKRVTSFVNRDSNGVLVYRFGEAQIQDIVFNNNDDIFISVLIYDAELNINKFSTYFSTDDGDTWNLYSDQGFKVLAIDSIGYLYGGSLGIYKSTSSTITSVENNLNKPDEFNLDQNYPNPFNPVTTIRYSITENNIVNLKVFDILGRLISTIVNENQKPGNYKVLFNGSNLASGIYFYRLSAGNFAETKKMILLK